MSCNLLNLFFQFYCVWISLDFLCTLGFSCHLLLEVILLPTFQSECLLFLFLALVRTSSIILNRRENEHSCIIPGLREKSFISMMLAVSFSWVLFMLKELGLDFFFFWVPPFLKKKKTLKWHVKIGVFRHKSIFMASLEKIYLFKKDIKVTKDITVTTFGSHLYMAAMTRASFRWMAILFNFVSVAVGLGDLLFWSEIWIIYKFKSVSNNSGHLWIESLLRLSSVTFVEINWLSVCKYNLMYNV